MKVTPLDYRKLRIMAGPSRDTIKVVYHDGSEHSPCMLAKHAAEYIARGAVDLRPGAKARPTHTQRPKPDMSRTQFVKALRALIPASQKPNAWAKHEAAIEAVLASAAGVLSKAEIAGYRKHARELQVPALQQVVAERRASQARMDARMGLAPRSERVRREGNLLVLPTGVA